MNSSGLFKNDEQFEIEIEVIDSTHTELLNKIKSSVKLVLSALQQTNYPISYPQQNQVYKDYLDLIGVKETRVNPRFFIGPSSLTLQYDVQLLPDTTLGDSLYGIVNVSVTPMREKPKHSSQMVDQVILGDYVKILLAIEDWYLIQTDYDYVGWISRPTIHRCGQNELSNWNKNARYRVNTLNSMIYSKPDIKSLPVSDAVLNNRLIIKRLSSRWVKAILPDGRIGYLDTSFIVPITNEIDIQKFQRLIRSTAISMKGVPYLWGGKSSKGSDCSGFTQTVFKSAGFQLPRDARQQADLGNFIIKEDLEIGDLLFFGDKERITHVGISMGGLEFIHQGIKLEGKVDLHSLDPQSPSYNEYRENSFMFAKRIRPTS